MRLILSDNGNKLSAALTNAWVSRTHYIQALHIKASMMSKVADELVTAGILEISTTKPIRYRQMNSVVSFQADIHPIHKQEVIDAFSDHTMLQKIEALERMADLSETHATAQDKTDKDRQAYIALTIQTRVEVIEQLQSLDIFPSIRKMQITQVLNDNRQQTINAGGEVTATELLKQINAVKEGEVIEDEESE